jgi:hypothetical protein
MADHIVAHKIGHILRGSNAHFRVGIILSAFLPDWEKATQGALGFTPSQNQQIRTWIAKRSRN